MTTQDEGFSLLIPVRVIVRALEREAENTDTDPRWRAARELRWLGHWDTRTLSVTGVRLDLAPAGVTGSMQDVTPEAYWRTRAEEFEADATELRRKLDELRADAERWRTIIHLRRTSHRWMIELYGNAMEPEKWIAYPHGTYYSTAEGAIDGAAGDVALTSKRGDRDEP